jgi:hypothetical protein
MNDIGKAQDVNSKTATLAIRFIYPPMKHIGGLTPHWRSEDTCKNFALLAMCCVFVPNSAYNIDSKWIKYVYNVDKMKKMNWNKAVLNFLIKAIRNYRNNASYLCGDMLFLVVSNL